MQEWSSRLLLAGMLSLAACTGDRPGQPAGEAAATSSPGRTATASPAARNSRIPQPRLDAAGDQSLSPGGSARLVLRVSLPAGLHVQSNAPKDPNLIPTVLHVTAPEGLAVVSVAYPRPVDLLQASQLLTVYDSEFEIIVTLRAASTAPRGPVVVPAELKYQACNDSVCFAPSNASTSWRLEVV